MTSYLSVPRTLKTSNYLNGIPRQFSTLIDLLDFRASCQSDRVGYSFLDNGERVNSSLTYQALHQKACTIAAHLQQRGITNQQALLLYPPGLEFISAFFGCLYAGVVAVPIYPPRRNQSRERLAAIAQDAGAAIALTTTSLLNSVESQCGDDTVLASLNWLATDNLDNSFDGTWQPPNIRGDSLAFLQYTSGSTGKPKGVMVTHANLLHNSFLIHQNFGHDANSRGVIWLPLYHDMGLIGGVLQPLYGGFEVTLMSPVDFLQKPLRWLESISRTSATTSGGPNFAYDLCVNKVTPEQLETLDLSSWDVAFTGAEPIRADTLEAFAKTFAPCGFRQEAFYPCYGMAEATLLVAGGIKSQAPILQTVDEEALLQNRVVPLSKNHQNGKTLVGCGQARLETKMLIVDPDTLIPCQPNEVGEIWVCGASIAQGYWNEPEKTQDTFGAYLAQTGEGPFLRTGDLGTVNQEGELFVTGRIKDVIIIRGRNHYPQDIELTIEQAHQALIPHRSAAFSIEVDGEEKLIVAVEVERRYRERRQSNESCNETERRLAQRRQENADPGFEVELSDTPIFENIVADIRQAITVHHGLQVYGVLLLRVGTIPKTSSGKIQRFACRKGFLEKSLTLVYRGGVSY